VRHATLASIAFTVALGAGSFALGAALPASAEAATLSPTETMILVNKATKALDVWDLPTAVDAADALEKGAPDAIDSMEARALVRFHQGRYDDAVKILDVLRDKGRKDNETTKLIRKCASITKKFAEKKGAHFTIRYAPGPDAILADWALETLEAQRAALEKDLGFAPPENVPVEIFPTGDEFATVTTLTREEIETTGTIALCKFNKLMVTSPSALPYGYPWRDTIAHEYTHYVVARSTNNAVPIWLHEGLAKYEEVRWRRPAGGEKSPTTETVLSEAMAKNYWVPLHKMHPSIAKLPTAFDATLAFAEVEDLIGFCVKTWDYQGLRTLLAGLRDDKPMDVALLGAFGVGLDGLEAKWHESLNANPPHAHPDLSIMPIALKDPKADADASGAAHKGLSDDAGEHLRLGDMLAGEVRLDAAVIEYHKARDAEKASGQKSGHVPIFDYKVAQTYILGNRFADAKKTLTPVIDTYPDYAPALKAMGRVELAENAPAKAREYLERSLWISPFDPEVYAMLADASEKAGDKPAAQAWDARFKALLKSNGMMDEPTNEPKKETR